MKPRLNDWRAWRWQTSWPALACSVSVALALGLGAASLRLQGQVPALSVPRVSMPRIATSTLLWPEVVAPEPLSPAPLTTGPAGPGVTSPARATPLPALDIRLAPQRPPSLLAQAQAAWRRGDLAAARTAYLAARAQTPHGPEPELGLAAVAVREGARALAASHYQAALRIDPDNAIARLGLLAHPLTGAARRELEHSARNPAERARVHYASGCAAADREQWALARPEFAAAYAIAPTADYALALALTLDHLGLTAEAARYYRDALRAWTAARSAFDPEPVRLRLQALTASF